MSIYTQLNITYLMAAMDTGLHRYEKNSNYLLILLFINFSSFPLKIPKYLNLSCSINNKFSIVMPLLFFAFFSVLINFAFISLICRIKIFSFAITTALSPYRYLLFLNFLYLFSLIHIPKLNLKKLHLIF